MYTLFDKPTENMNKSMRELNEAAYNESLESYKQQEERRKLEESALRLEQEEREKYLYGINQEAYASVNKRNEFLHNVKTSFLSECLCKLYQDCSTPLLEADKIIVKNLVNKFIEENGVDELLNKFATENLLLAEFSNIVRKGYDAVLESRDKGECEDGEATKARDFTIADEIKDTFYNDLADVDTEEASALVKERVADAMGEFVDTNIANKLEYEDIIQSAKDRMGNVKNESFIDEISNQAKLKINELKNSKTKNMFHYMVESLSKKSVKDSVLGTRYVHEGALNMNNIVNDVQLIYTMLEMVNTTNMVNVDEDYMNKYIESLA